MTSSPSSHSQNISVLTQFTNELMYECGDKAVDFSHYTRRIDLLSILVSSHAVFLQDDCTQMEQTRRYIERKIASSRFTN